MQSPRQVTHHLHLLPISHAARGAGTAASPTRSVPGTSTTAFQPKNTSCVQLRRVSAQPSTFPLLKSWDGASAMWFGHVCTLSVPVCSTQYCCAGRCMLLFWLFPSYLNVPSALRGCFPSSAVSWSIVVTCTTSSWTQQQQQQQSVRPSLP